jgi:mobilome CxxCx(11)CxxC protein
MKIFERRMRRLGRGRNWITYLGIVVPLLVGSVVLSFGKEWLTYALIPAGIIGAVQLALSAWSLVAKWDDSYSYSVGAVQSLTRLFNSWDTLCKRMPADLEQRVNDLDPEDQRQELADLAQSISEREKRYGMRASLYHFGNTCQRCGVRPVSMNPLNCDTCGNF